MSTRIVFTGDISFSKHFAGAWENPALLSADVLRYLEGADHVVANVECPLTAREIRSARVLNHACAPEAGAFLSTHGIRNWSLANNHIMDCGAEGLADTVACAAENGCTTVGAGADEAAAAQPLMLGNDVRIGILSLAKPWTYLRAGAGQPGALTWEHTALVRKQIAGLRKKGADWIVVIAHGGDEYAPVPLPYMRKTYHSLLQMGADLVVAHHPHVVQNYELPEQNKAIFYSLGNFIFDTDNQREFAHTDTGILLGIDFRKDGFSFDHLALKINRTDHTVESGETPAIFTEITAADYEKIWPLSAKYFYPVDLKNRKTLHKKMQKYKGPLLLIHELAVCRHRREREIQQGRALSLLGKWKSAGCQAVVRYIKGEKAS